jgi:hypothetical protein
MKGNLVDGIRSVCKSLLRGIQLVWVWVSVIAVSVILAVVQLDSDANDYDVLAGEF